MAYKILVIQGAGLNMRGKAQLEVFGPMTLVEYDENIRNYATDLSIAVEIFHSKSKARSSIACMRPTKKISTAQLSIQAVT